MSPPLLAPPPIDDKSSLKSPHVRTRHGVVVGSTRTTTCLAGKPEDSMAPVASSVNGSAIVPDKSLSIKCERYSAVVENVKACVVSVDKSEEKVSENGKGGVENVRQKEKKCPCH